MNTHPDTPRTQMLLRMAGEARAIEDGALEPRAGASPWWRLGIAAALLAAAFPTFLFVIRSAPHPAPPVTPPGPIVRAPEPGADGPIAAVVAPGSPDADWLDDIVRQLQRETGFGTLTSGDANRAMLLAVFRESPEACACVVWREAPFDGRPLAEVSRRELVEAALADRCASGAPLELVVAIEGEPSHLPESRDAAEALATCMTSGPEACGSDAGGLAASALSCLPAGVTVIAEGVR